MNRRAFLYGSVAMLAAPLAGEAQKEAQAVFTIVQDRIYRSGVFFVIDALVENRSTNRAEGVEVLVEFYNFFDELLRVEHGVFGPSTLGPGRVAALRVVTPYGETLRGETLRRLHYRFTWVQGGQQLQEVQKRDVWTIGSPTRALNTPGW
jgi:hypothetical protein